MLDIEYVCIDCGIAPSAKDTRMVCDCGGSIRGRSPGITGTRDSFGIKMAFRDDESGKEIDNWKSWEKAGFRNPVETHKDAKVNENIRRKIKQVKNR